MGNSATGKVILSNGGVFTYEEAVTVAELMLDHPQEAVVEFDPGVVSGKKAIPLPADQKLDSRKLYVMIPIRRGKTAPLPSGEAWQLLAETNYLLRTKPFLSYTGLLPFFLRFCPAAGVPAEPERLSKRSDHFADILEGRPEFLSRQISGKGWKPSLDPIREKTVRAKVRHWIF